MKRQLTGGGLCQDCLSHKWSTEGSSGRIVGFLRIEGPGFLCFAGLLDLAGGDALSFLSLFKAVLEALVWLRVIGDMDKFLCWVTVWLAGAEDD